MLRNILLVYNPFSGYFIGHTPAAVASYLKSMAKGQGDLILRPMPFNARKKDALRKEIQEKPTDAVWVAGGDGTVTAVADCLSNLDVPLGVLPLGTMNLLARDMGMALDLNRAVGQLRTARPVLIDTADINRHLILNICNIGFSTKFTQMREKFRHVSAWIRWPLMFWYMVQSLFVYPSFKIELKVNRERHIFRTRSVTITNNPLSEDSLILPSRRHINQGKLGIYIAKNTSFWSLPVLIIKLLVGRWHYDDDLIHLTAERATIIPRRKQRRRLRVMIDGELFKFKAPLRFKIKAKALKILKPGA